MNILGIRLSKWCNKFNIIDESHAGFRSGYSTIDNVFTLMALVQKKISKKNGQFYCIFVDYAKVFDGINHKQRAMMALGRSPEYHWNQIISKPVHQFSRSHIELFLFIALAAIQRSRTV